MKEIKDSPYVYIAALAAFNAILLFGLILGSKHPQIFGAMVMIFFSIVVAIYVAPSKKECYGLIWRVVLLAIVTSIVDRFIPQSWGGFVRMIALCITAGPFYIIAASYFVNMVNCSRKKE